MTFISPSMLLLLTLVPFLVGGYVAVVRRRSVRAAETGTTMLGALSPPDPRRRRHLTFGFFAIAITVLLIGLARPEIVIGLPRREGTVILAFDTSSSMTADDLDPTRLEAAKATARTFVEAQPSSIAVGIVTFDNGGSIIQPPTHDRFAILAAVDRIQPEGSTSLAQGIFTALDVIVEEPLSTDAEIGFHGSSLIIMLTDGENTEGADPLEIAALASKAGVKVYTVGLGTADGAVIEIDGFTVATGLDEDTLVAIAELTGGEYSRAGDGGGIAKIYDRVDREFRIEGEKTEVTALVAALAMALLLTGAALSMTWFGRVP